MLTRKRILLGTLGILMGLGLLLGGTARRAAAAEGVRFILDWLPYGKHAPFYVGLDRGIYKQFGLDVEILRGKGSGLALKTVGSKAAEFGQADAGSLVVARANNPDLRVKLVAMLHHKPLFNIVTLAKSGIKTPKDLAGKKIASTAANATRTVFPAFAELAGLDPKKVTWVELEPAIIGASLFSGKVDAIAHYLTLLPAARGQAKKAGKPIQSMAFADYGLSVYSNGLIAHEDTIRDRAALARAFVRASLEAVKWSVENPEGAMTVFLKRFPTRNPTVQRGTFDVSVDVLLTENTKRTGIGFMLRDKMQRTIDLMLRFRKGLKRRPAPEEVYTNEFVAVFPKRPEAK